MQNKKAVIGIILLALIVCGCAGSLNLVQKSELKTYRAMGLLVKEKEPGLGAALGILPGGGSFYTRNYGIGIVNLLLWPLSVLWDPINGYEGSLEINYFATKTLVNHKKSKEIEELEDQMQAHQISLEEFIIRKNKIEKKYSSE